ncbi:hypothetical protein PF005_g9361 [Phytophthora fragariae]|uniref:Uncharacterized protein n=1 Tax=Phytophthora fragariae TaxID=53985 RepID=A0A6A3YCD3_9STRA|nr:hypothetical protein PF005_g9361 [Phytophthora fragariae]
MSVTTGTDAAGAGPFFAGEGGLAIFATVGAAARVDGAGELTGDAARCAMALALDMIDVGEGNRLPDFGGLVEGIASFGGLALLVFEEVVIGGITLSEKLLEAVELGGVSSRGATAAGV